MINKKSQVLVEIFNSCVNANSFIFSNNEVKQKCKEVGFGNPFDATKVDSIDKIPEIIRSQDYAVIHLGNGLHQFVKGAEFLFHQFESIDSSNIIEWQYKPSILNTYNSSESNVLSVANNQRILHNFLYNEDKEFSNLILTQRPKTYFPHRTKTSFDFYINTQLVSLKNIQIEIDLTIEYMGIVSIFEAKNINLTKLQTSHFATYQLYMPWRYYYNAKASVNIKEIYAVYLVRSIENNKQILTLYQYTFTNPLNIASIKFIKMQQYILVKQ